VIRGTIVQHPKRLVIHITFMGPHKIIFFKVEAHY